MNLLCLPSQDLWWEQTCLGHWLSWHHCFFAHQTCSTVRWLQKLQWWEEGKEKTGRVLFDQPWSDFSFVWPGKCLRMSFSLVVFLERKKERWISFFQAENPFPSIPLLVVDVYCLAGHLVTPPSTPWRSVQLWPLFFQGRPLGWDPKVSSQGLSARAPIWTWADTNTSLGLQECTDTVTAAPSTGPGCFRHLSS